MDNSDLKRLSRLTAMLTALQAKKIVTAAALAKQFGVSVRTIYRDIRALEQAGIPIVAEERKGYSLLEGYRIPPVMFTENEANALITAEHLVEKNGDTSLVKEYAEAIRKIKAVLSHSAKDKTALLSERIAVSPARPAGTASNSLALIQQALTSFTVLNITYRSENENKTTRRAVEPFAFYYSQENNWLLIARCRLRSDYRMFRLDRIATIELLRETFEPHRLTLQEFLDAKEKNFHTG